MEGAITNNEMDAIPGYPGMAEEVKQQESEESRFPLIAQPSSRLRLSQLPGLVGRFKYSWKNLSVSAPARRGNCFRRKNTEVNPQGAPLFLPILRSVSGEVKAGQLWALMGSSGAGKTTLLNSLTFRNASFVKVEGDRCINGEPVNPQFVSSVSAYLPQDDLFVPILTVKEHLMFNAMVKLPSYVSRKQKKDRVDEVIKEVGLWHARNSYIGGIFTKGISGGEKRRLAFAAVILTDPNILFCDEPTTGLDSFMAKIVVDIMLGMAKRGKLVVCTIHQPSTEVFQEFTHLYILAEGRTVYSGKREDALKFFGSLGHNCPASYNPADFYVKTLSIRQDDPDACREKVAAIALAFGNTNQYHKIQENAAKPSADPEEIEELRREFARIGRYPANYFIQFYANLWREMVIVFRSPEQSLVNIGAMLFLGLFFGVIYYKIHLNYYGIGSLSGVLVLCNLVELLFPTYTIIVRFTDTVPLVLREHWGGMYSLFPYCISRSLVEMLIYSLYVFFYFPEVFYMIGFHGGFTNFLWHSLTLVLCANAGAAAGFMVATISPNVQMGIVNAILVVVPLFIFCGFLSDEDDLPIVFKYLKYVSMAFYGCENMMSTEWNSVTKDDLDLGILAFLFPNGTAVLKFYNYEDNYLRNSLMIVLIAAVYRILGVMFFFIRGRR